ncbi:YciI family protein [Kribbella sp. NPDC051586]|uniref:YciI family protein n=1 Tax=Kribbella sp. NPDC051586 TaxID=3364118 RepID=UPI0037B85EDD
MLLIRPDEDYPDGVPEDMIRRTEAWVADVQARGVHLTGGALHPPAQATGVRRQGARIVTTDGPFAESKEQMGGFDLIECETLAEAIEIAAAHPVAGAGQVEIRPVVDDLKTLIGE